MSYVCVYQDSCCSHLGVIEELSQQWTVQRQGSHGFSSVACDMAIEQTLNRDSKTSGGKVLKASCLVFLLTCSAAQSAKIVCYLLYLILNVKALQLYG